MKKILLTLSAAAIGISILILILFRGWLLKVHGTLPPEGKAIFEKMNPDQCSSQNCEACTETQCGEHEISCVVREYQWTTDGASYQRLYCAKK